MAQKKKLAATSPPEMGPPALPADPARFWRAPIDLGTLLPPEEVDRTATLQRLGALPFSGSGFPLMGFLATLYEHVANSARDAMNPEDESRTTSPLS
jgi:hypothetical protein